MMKKWCGKGLKKEVIKMAGGGGGGVWDVKR